MRISVYIFIYQKMNKNYLHDVTNQHPWLQQSCPKHALNHEYKRYLNYIFINTGLIVFTYYSDRKGKRFYLTQASLAEPLRAVIIEEISSFYFITNKKLEESIDNYLSVTTLTMRSSPYTCCNCLTISWVPSGLPSSTMMTSKSTSLTTGGDFRKKSNTRAALNN